MLSQPFHKSFYVPSLMIVTQYSKRLFPQTLTCFWGYWVIGLSGKICTRIFVVNNKYNFKRFLFNIYIVNFNIGLETLIDTGPWVWQSCQTQENIGLANVSNPKYLGLMINLTQCKHGSQNDVRPKTLWFKNYSVLWLWRTQDNLLN